MGIKIDSQPKTRKKHNQDRVSILDKEIHLFGKGFSNRAKEDFYGELSVLLKSGINLKDSLSMISEIQKKKKDQQFLESISEQIVLGDSLSETLEKKDDFSKYEVQAIKIGEETGQLGKVTGDLRDYFHRKNELKRQLIASLSYPIIVLGLAVLVVFFMLRYVVPMFADIFKQNNVELPWLTQQVVNISEVLSGLGWWFVIIVLGFIFLLQWVTKTEGYYRFIGRFQLRIPILGNYFKRIYLIQFTQAMSLLTRAKIPVVTGLGLTKEMIRFYPIEQTLRIIEKDVVQGEKLNVAFGKHALYDKKMIALLRVAEETNQTEFIFQKLYEQYNGELQYKGKVITSVFNFLLTLVVGVLVGVILVAMYLPMFKLSSVIG